MVLRRRSGLLVIALMVALGCFCLVPAAGALAIAHAATRAGGAGLVAAPSTESSAGPGADTTPGVEPTVTPAADATVTLVAVGDLMVSRAQLASGRVHGVYDFAASFARVASTISAADVAVGNLETTLRPSAFTGYPCFRSPTSYVRALKDAGFDVLTTANNHTLDGGAYGVRYTADYLDKLGIAHTGSDNAGTAIVEHDGVRIAFIAYTYATNGIHSPFAGAVDRLDVPAIKRAIKAARAKADLVVVCMHWGSEYSRTPEKLTRTRARGLIDAGADLILGSHPHMVRPVEKYKGRYIVYSMGNFLAGMTRTYTDLGMIASLTIRRAGGVTKVTRLKVLPTFCDVSRGHGRSTYRTVLISQALKRGAPLISASDRRHMRTYLAYCKRVFSGLL
jgi:poly-gamma-glutamate synthesis protein (capsule biosynthesis protein)